MSHRLSFEEVCLLSDQDLLAYFDVLDATPAEIRTEIKSMSDEEFITTYGFGADELIDELRAEILSLTDEELREVHGIETPAEIRASLLRMKCLDCDMWTDNEYYMVHAEIWTSVAGEDDGMLCIGCLENRLGRMLTRDDFTDVPINHASYAHTNTERLNNRLGHTTP